MQLIWQTYTFLRDSHRHGFTDHSLQQKQAKAMRDQLVKIENRLDSRAAGNHNSGPGARTPNPGGNGGGAVRCGRCRSAIIHPDVGAASCPFLNYHYSVSKAMGKTTEGLISGGKTKVEAIATSIEKHKND